LAINNPTGIKYEEKPANEAGRRIIDKADSYVGIVENPALSDTGSDIDRWNDFFGTSAIPWAGSFAAAMYWESKVWDQEIGDPNPQIMYDRAKSLKRLTGIPFPGCFVLYGTDDGKGGLNSVNHVEIFVRWYREDELQILTIGGNIHIGDPVSNHGVQIQIRNARLPNISDTTKRVLFAVPKAVSLREAKKRK